MLIYLSLTLSLSISSALGSYSHTADVSVSNSNRCNLHLVLNSDGPIMDGTQITVLTHGMGGSYLDWWETDDAFYSVSDLLPSLISNKFYVFGEEGLKSRIDINDNGTFVRRSFNGNGLANINMLTRLEIGEHIVLLYDGPDDTQEYFSNEEVYDHFEKSLDSMIYTVYSEFGVVPKLNLVGHSRGGITNIEYAINHPRLVSNLMSVGTPYFGSDWADCLLSFATVFSDAYDRDVYSDLFYSENSGGFHTMQSEWNSIAESENINTTIVNAVQSFDFFSESLQNSVSWLSDYFESFGLDEEETNAAISNVAEWLNTNLTSCMYNTVNWLSRFRPLVNLLTWQIQDQSLKAIAEERIEELLRILQNDLEINGSGNNYVLSDSLVEQRSQKGRRIMVGNQEQSYSCFNICRYNFDNYSDDLRLTRNDMPLIAHNLETKNQDICGIFYEALNEDAGFLHSHSFSIGHSESEHFAECSCGASILNNGHGWTYSSYDSERCLRSCGCGYSETLPHSLEYSSGNSIIHGEFCSVCGYSNMEAGHNYTVSTYNSSSHVLRCGCGAAKIEAHRYGSLTRRCSVCGYRNISL